MRPERDNIAAPALPPRLRGSAPSAAAGRAELTAAGPGAGPLLRLRPAQQRPRAPLRDRVGPALPRRGPGDARRPLPPLPVHRATRGARRRRSRGSGSRHPVADDSGYGSGTTTGARAGRRSSSGARAGRCGGFTSARASTRRPRRRSRRSCAAHRPDAEPPPPLEPLRPSDAPGALVVAADATRSFRAARRREPWRAGADAARARAQLRGGRRPRHRRRRRASSGRARRRPRASARRSRARPVRPRGPRAPRAPRVATEPSSGLELYSVSFSAGVP